MTNGQIRDNENRNYRGMRALILLRVSTPEQEKGFGWQSQEREIREKLIEPLGLRVDNERHIIRDTYTGLEFKERAALDRILEIAGRGEIDIVATDVLDRLGRRGLAREIYRMQLREKGVRILTTSPEDHADDDSLTGELIRILRGHEAERELDNIRRRTMNGKRAKVEGLQKDGTVGERKLIGCGPRKYGYKYVLSTRGKQEMYELNLDTVLIDEDGGIWTEVAVVMFVFNASEHGIPIRQIVLFLNNRGIPSPKGKGWNKTTISRMLRDKAYKGEAVAFATCALPKVPGRKRAPRVKTLPEEQVIVPIPRIIEDRQYDAVQTRLSRNKKEATRNLKHPYKGLLRAGLAKCAQCNASLSIQIRPGRYKNREGIDADEIRYQCNNYTGAGGLKCKGCAISARLLDNAAWAKAVEIIRDPTQVEKKLEQWMSNDPTAERRKIVNRKLKELKKQQEAMRENLASLLKTSQPDQGTIDFLNSQLKQLATQEEEYQGQLVDDERIHQLWIQIQEKVEELHKVCADMREKLNDPTYIPDYDRKRELILFFGITAKVWKADQPQRFKIESRPPDIMSRISSTMFLWLLF